MANIANRSPWVVEVAGHESRQFPRKKKAQEWAQAQTTPGKRAPKVYQLETAFEVQVIRKDSAGNVIRRSSTFDTRKQAEDWAQSTEQEVLVELKDRDGKFHMSAETMTLRQGFDLLIEQHYKGKSSENENTIRAKQICAYFGEQTLIRNIRKEDLQKWRDKLKDKENYRASSIRNFFTVMSMLFKHAIKEWNFPIRNPCQDVSLPKKDNAIERNWQGNEEEVLLSTIEKERPWLLPIVKLALALTFRKGELVAGSKNRKTGKQRLGLVWEGVNFKEETIKLFHEKNDHTKSPTEAKGRVVPMSNKAKEILLPLYEVAKTKGPLHFGEPTGPVFEGTVSSVTKAFNHCRTMAGVKDFTFHTTRKIGTYEAAKHMTNAMDLSRITGHKNIEILNRTYYKARIDDLRKSLNRNIDKKDRPAPTTQEMILFGKGLELLTSSLGEETAQQFLHITQKVALSTDSK